MTELAGSKISVWAICFAGCRAPSHDRSADLPSNNKRRLANKISHCQTSNTLISAR
jgi:hypothetical protein